MVYVCTQPKWADQLIVRSRRAEMVLAIRSRKILFVLMRGQKDVSIQPVAIFSTAINAIKIIKMDRCCTDDLAGFSVFLTTRVNEVIYRGDSPLVMKQLSIWRKFFAWRKAAKDRPDFNLLACARLFVNQAACRKHGIIEVRGNVYPAHRIFLPQNHNEF